MKTLLSFLLLATSLLHAQPDFNAKLDTLLHVLEENDKTMGSLVIANGDEIAYQKGIGHANLETGEKNTPSTLFRIGSISKTFTATIIMQMVEEKLKLSTTLAEYFPNLPNASSITIKQMLGHRSGLFNFTNAEAYPGYMTEAKSREELFEIFRKNGTVFKPGERMEYSNTNYVLLSFIAEEVDGQSFADIFENRIAEPLDLKNTFIDTREESRHEAKSYEWAGEWQDAPVTDPSIPMGAGAVVSTPLELNHFFSALFNAELCSEQNLSLMKEEKLGLFQFPFGELQAFGHNGGIDGFLSNAAYFPEKDATFVFLSNGMNYTLNDVMIGVLSIYFGQSYRIPTFEPPVEIDTAILEKYTGTYVSDNFPMDITVDITKGQLRAKPTGQPAIVMEARSEQLFTFSQAGIELEFPEKDKMILRQNGLEFEFVKE